jgi:hypothetical protein
MIEGKMYREKLKTSERKNLGGENDYQRGKQPVV